MLIDWFTVIAQIVNFLILIALLKYLLYGRIIKAMDQREERIASRIRDAEQRERRAEEEAEEYRNKNREFEERKQEMLSKAGEEAEQRKREMLQEARREVDRVQARWRQAVQREKDSFLRDLRQRAGHQVYSIARRALRDLADAQLERHIVDVFIERVESLEPERRKAIAEAVKEDRELSIRSAFEVNPDDRGRLTDTIKRALGDTLDITFQTAPDMILGVELKARGHKIAWSLDDYLESLESHISRLLEEEVKSSEKEPSGTDE